MYIKHLMRTEQTQIFELIGFCYWKTDQKKKSE